MKKKYLYIGTFIVAGEALFGFFALLFAMYILELSARGALAQSPTVCANTATGAAFLLMVTGGFLGLWGGVHFWPILYHEDGSLRFTDWRGLRERLRNVKDQNPNGQMKPKDQNQNSGF